MIDNSTMRAAVDKIRGVVRRPGFIHTLSFLVANKSLFKSQFAVQTRNRFELISFHEVGLLLSVMSERSLDLAFPSSAEMNFQYTECKRLLEELHTAISALSRPQDISRLFSDGPSFIEPIFYAASSAFWFDYLELAPQLYDFDKEFLGKKGYLIADFAELLRQCHQVFYRRYRDFVRSQRRSFRRQGLIGTPLECFLFSSSDIDRRLLTVFKMFSERFSVEPGSVPPVEDTDPISSDEGEPRSSGSGWRAIRAFNSNAMRTAF